MSPQNREAKPSELWQQYSRKYLDKYGERPTIRLSGKNTLILAILDLSNDTYQRHSETDDSGETSFD